ncbi:transporter substrate-binding domain-containing protein [Clostridium vitabionis]|uniref:transporter substrate-binding domain-containing protein n=1 Tax=Clostridium vitabionis TaxID=2784388 RepID=UPI00188A155E|nr:transporter substrate-binding domain-containing protein [Clostridium vitabionis]
MKKRWTRQTAALVAAVTAAGLLAACGGSGAANKTAAAGTQGQGSAAAGADSSASGEKTTITAVTAASPRPFTYYDESNQLTGMNIDLTNAIFAKLPQYDLRWEVTDFPSIFAGLDSNRYQLGVNNFSMNEERKEKYLFSDPMFANQLIVVAGKNVQLGDSDTIDYSDLAGLNFVGQSGIFQTTNVENYNDANPDKKININYTEEDLSVQLKDVQDGKYDFLTIDAPMYYGYYEPEFGYDLQVKNLAGFGTTDGMYSYYLLSKGSDQLLKDINSALREVIEDGTSKEINEKYFDGKDYTPDLSALTSGN